MVESHSLIKKLDAAGRVWPSKITNDPTPYCNIALLICMDIMSCQLPDDMIPSSIK